MLPNVTRERQVLVVGDNVPGLVLARLLNRSGLEPVVLASPGHATPSSVATLWAGGVHLLEGRLGLGDVTSQGIPVDAVRVRPTAESDTERREAPAGKARDWPVVVGTAELREALAGALGADATRLRTGLSRVSPRGDRVDVEFANGVRESFDIVVGADGPDSAVRAATDQVAPDWPALAQAEAWFDREASGGPAVMDCPADGRCVQVLPGPGADGEATLRVTAPAGGAALVSSPTDIDDFGIPPSDATRDVTRTSVRQAIRPDDCWRSDRLAFCGGAALPVAPASGMRTALGLEDAWVLADELSRGPDTVTAALQRYERRRARRLGRLFRQLRDVGWTGNVGYPPEGPLGVAVSLWTATIDALDSASVVGLSRPIPRRR